MIFFSGMLCPASYGTFQKLVAFYGGQLQTIHLEQSALAVELFSGVEETYVKIPAKSFPAVIKTEGLVVEPVHNRNPWKDT